MILTIPQISDFHYHYVDGKLRNVSTGAAFHWVNQAHYDALGDTIVKHIQSLLSSEYGLKEVLLPIQEHRDEYEYEGPSSNIFVSEDWQTSDKLLLLIQGSGAVRYMSVLVFLPHFSAGQWARALCINDSLDIGTIFPYLTRAKVCDG